MEKDWEKTYWNKRALAHGASAPCFGASESEADEKFYKAFESMKDCDTLLDLGCGTGRLYDVLAKHCKQYTGLDFSQEMLKLFREGRMLRENDKLELGEASDMPFADSSFDGVVSSVVLQHIVDPEKFLKVVAEIKRVLKPDGVLYLLETALSGVSSWQPFFYQKIRSLEHYKTVFAPEIMLKDQGTILTIHHLLVGEKKIIDIDYSKIAVDVGSGKNRVYGTLGIDSRAAYSYGKLVTDIIADARALPLKRSCVDELWCCNVLEHFENPYPLLFEIHRVVKDDAIIIFEVPYPGTHSSDADPDHKFIPSPDNWNKILGGFFQKLHITPLGVKIEGEERWKRWQINLLNLGFYGMSQGARRIQA